MRGAHAARAVLLMTSCCVCQWAAAGQDLPNPSPTGRGLVEREPAAMPHGMVDLCRRQPVLCAPDPRPRRIVLPRRGDRALLAAVNVTINHRIASTTDRAFYGRDEYWALPTTAGDCEDYVLLKRRVLMAMGMPEASLLITVVHDENGEGHAVLTVPTRAGDLVLDNRRDAILPWWQTGYSFIKRQSERDISAWVSLGPDRLQATDIASAPGKP